MAINGMTVAAPFNGGGVSTYILDSVNVDEVSVAVAGGLGESDIGGPVMNLVPRSGGNAFRGQAFINNAGDWSKGNNLERRAARRRPHGDARHHQLLRRERLVRRPDQARPTVVLWQLSQARYGHAGPGRRRERAMPTTPRAGTGWATTASRRGSCRGATIVHRPAHGAGRPHKNRVTFNQEYQRRCEGSPLKVDSDGCNTRGADWIAAGTRPRRPRRDPNYFDIPVHLTQAIWTAPMTNRLLLEAGFTRFYVPCGRTGPGPAGRDLRSDLGDRAVDGDQSGDRHSSYAPRANYVYRAVPTSNANYANPNNWRASASYVTGVAQHEGRLPGRCYIRVEWSSRTRVAAVRTGSTAACRTSSRSALPEWQQADRTSTSALFVQDTWTRGRLTLQGALRYDRAWSFSPAERQRHDADVASSIRGRSPSSETAGVDAFNDITPRFGAAYDVFGNGKTAMKFNLGHYLDAATNDSSYTQQQPGDGIVRMG